MYVGSAAIASMPIAATTVSGKSSESNPPMTAVDATAFLVSFLVSWYSGENVAGASGKYEDHAITQNQTMPRMMAWPIPGVPP